MRNIIKVKYSYLDKSNMSDCGPLFSWTYHSMLLSIMTSFTSSHTSKILDLAYSSIQQRLQVKLRPQRSDNVATDLSLSFERAPFLSGIYHIHWRFVSTAGFIQRSGV
jgi:hypothetical protein